MCKTCTTFSARPSLQNDMNGGVAAEQIEEEAEQRSCPDLDAHWRLDEAQETIQRLTQERDEARRERDEWKDSAIKAMADLERAEQPRPLTPDAITDEMIERARTAWNRSSALGNDLWRDVLRAALTEPPKRPEGAEEMEALIGSWERSELLGQNLTTDDLNSLADHLAERVASVGLTPTNPEEQP